MTGQIVVGLGNGVAQTTMNTFTAQGSRACLFHYGFGQKFCKRLKSHLSFIEYYRQFLLLFRTNQKQPRNFVHGEELLE
jgi:hypothetical protein